MSAGWRPLAGVDRIPIEGAPEAYDRFGTRPDDCPKVLIEPETSAE